jgi:hypothetical protein
MSGGSQPSFFLGIVVGLRTCYQVDNSSFDGASRCVCFFGGFTTLSRIAVFQLHDKLNVLLLGI